MSRRREQTIAVVVLVVMPCLALAVDGCFGFRVSWLLFDDAIHFVLDGFKFWVSP